MHPIPRNATRIEYLESDGSQWIDTGINGQSGLVVNAKFWMQRDDVNVVTLFFGASNSATSIAKRYYVGVGNFRGAPRAVLYYSSRYITAVNRDDGDFDVSLNDNSALINKTSMTTTTASEFDSGLAMHVFGTNKSDGTHTANSRLLRMKSFSVSKDGVTLCDYVPVRVGNVGCVFDRVTGQFIYGSGTGDFVCGPDDVSKFAHAVKHMGTPGKIMASRVKGKENELPYDAEVEYIENTTAGQYIDSDTTYEPGTKFQVTVKCANMSTGRAIICGNYCGNGCSFNVEFKADGSARGYVQVGGHTADMSSSALERGVGYRILVYHQTGIAALVVNGSTVDTRTGMSGTGTNTNPIRFFMDYRSGTGVKGPIRLYDAQIRKDGVTVQHFIPVRVGNEYCLYDKLNPTGGDNGDGLYHNKGGGAFLGGADKPKIKPVRKHYDLATYYTIDECNGNAPTMVNANFPSDKYDALDYTPTWSGHRFVGWYTTSATPSTTAPTSGTQVQKGDSVVFDRSTVYARWQLPTTVTFDATTNGGQMPSGWVSPGYYIGQVYGTLPEPTKSGEVFLGWFTSGGTRVTESSAVTTGTLTARYAAVTWATTYSCTTTSSYKNTGIYSANRYSSSDPIVVDWGDGTTNVVYGNISQLAHTYSSVATYTVKISDNISTFCPSCNNSTWYYTTSQNSYTFKKVLTLSSKVTQLSSYAFYYCSAMTDVIIPSVATSIPDYCFYYCSSLKSSTVQFPSTVTSIGSYAFYFCTSSNFSSITIPGACTSIGMNAFAYCYYLHPAFASGSSAITLGTYAFSRCGYDGSAFTIDMSPRKVSNIPDCCFNYCRYLKGFAFPQNATSIGSSAFGYCFNQSVSTGTIEIPEGVTSISGTYAFRNCTYLTAVTLPSTITNLNNNTFYYCPRLATITCNRSTAPTVLKATFGNSSTYYTGRNSYSAGTNKLYVPAGATGYNASYWASVLLDSTKCGFTLEEMAAGKTLPVTIVGSGYGGNTSYSMTIDDVGGTLTITNISGDYSFADSSYWNILDCRATSTTESFVIMETATNSNIVVGLKTYGCSEDFVGCNGAIIDSADFEP